MRQQIHHVAAYRNPLREGAALKAGCPAARLVRLGGAYHPSLGISSERVQPFVVAADALADSVLQRLCFVALDELLDGAGQVRDGHLLVSAFRLSGALVGVQA
jgi:hypothetical protein